ncbi:hypothetical protein KM92DES2_20247 [uncultured Desulfovibrio sp.]|uniref:Uncharacterized protein n=1 Tax=uncultured Desulfovibrio sp. TaxID=167968 RepID=A0A212KJT0_9BACT|nr:hypothetical protein KM92DES2_20247 [uncultured Desulfovibrio sp.]
MQARQVDLSGLHGHYPIDLSATLTATDEHRTYAEPHATAFPLAPFFGRQKSYYSACLCADSSVSAGIDQCCWRCACGRAPAQSAGQGRQMF